MGILLIYYTYVNGQFEQKSILTDLHKEALINARAHDQINLYHYDNSYSQDEYREIHNIRYDGNVKHIHLSN